MLIIIFVDMCFIYINPFSKMEENLRCGKAILSE